MKLSLTACALFAGFALAVPAPKPDATKTLQARSTTICGQWDSVVTGTYIVYQDLWGESSGTGSQCTTVGALSGSSLAWSTSWSWSGGSSSVKSFANVQIHNMTSHALSSVKSLNTVWKWSYTGSNIDADVAYDLFTGSSLTATATYEVMIWLASYGGAGPISATGSTIATPSIAGTTWKLYKGSNGSQTVFSFVAPSTITSFSADLNLFLKYLTTSQGLSSSQILQSVAAGTEPFTGSNAVLTTSAYSVTYST